MYLFILKLFRIKTFWYYCYCRHISTKYHVQSQAVCHQFFHGARLYELYKMNCRPMCKVYSMKSIQVRLYPSLIKAIRFLQYTKKLQRVQKVLPEFVRILSTAELSLPSGSVMTSHEIKGSKLVILLTHKNIKKH